MLIAVAILNLMAFLPTCRPIPLESPNSSHVLCFLIFYVDSDLLGQQDFYNIIPTLKIYSSYIRFPYLNLRPAPPSKKETNKKNPLVDFLLRNK